MGAWGIKKFENDNALDFTSDVVEGLSLLPLQIGKKIKLSLKQTCSMFPNSYEHPPWYY
jgi:hypothetical protein